MECKYCGAELSETMNCTGCGSSTGEAAEKEYGCHNCGAYYGSYNVGVCSCGHSVEELNSY